MRKPRLRSQSFHAAELGFESVCFRSPPFLPCCFFKNVNILSFLMYLTKLLSESVGSMSRLPDLGSSLRWRFIFRKFRVQKLIREFAWDQQEGEGP